jgi:hypothetical protein
MLAVGEGRCWTYHPGSLYSAKSVRETGVCLPDDCTSVLRIFEASPKRINFDGHSPLTDRSPPVLPQSIVGDFSHLLLTRSTWCQSEANEDLMKANLAVGYSIQNFNKTEAPLYTSRIAQAKIGGAPINTVSTTLT